MATIQFFSTLFLWLTIVLCGGTILWYVAELPWRAARVEEIRRLRQEGLAVNQEGEA
jgi:hypothetical protein